MLAETVPATAQDDLPETPFQAEVMLRRTREESKQYRQKLGKWLASYHHQEVANA